MKVLLVGNAKYIHVRRWALGLAEAGVEVFVFTKNLWELPGVDCILDEVPPPRPWRPYRWNVRRSHVLRRVLSRVKPDVVHVHFLGPESVYLEDVVDYPLFVSPWGRDIISDDGAEPDEARNGKVALLRRADRVVCLSHLLARETQAYAGLEAADVVVQHWGADLSHFRRTRARTEEPVVGFFKHLLPKYGPAVLIEAFADVRQQIKDARLLMVGSGDLKEELQNQAARLNVGEAVEWVGKVGHDELPGLFERCAITAMPSTLKSETLGVAAIESQAMEVPVIGSDIGGIPESICDGETGLLVPPCDPAALAGAMISLLSDHSRRQAMAAAGRRYVENHFDWKKTVQQMALLYNT